MNTAFDYLFDLSMSMSECDTDREALREAHTVLASMSSDCRTSSVWPELPAVRARHTYRALAA
jgi:hypothetical protein